LPAGAVLKKKYGLAIVLSLLAGVFLFRNPEMVKASCGMIQTTRLRFLFDKYLQKRCSPEELEELLLLLHEDHARDSLDSRLKELWGEIHAEDISNPVDWATMYQTVIHAEERLPLFRTSRTPTVLKIAALLILTIGLFDYWYAYRFARAEKKNEPISRVEEKKNNYPESKKQILHLPDGSTVILNSGSQLHYPSAFRGRTREVYLSGEAYFDILHDQGKPFLVHTGKITTRVLGTAFDIKAYPGDESIKVTVTRGKVQVLRENKSLGMITANQQISYSKITEISEEKTVNSKILIAWKPEEINFNDVTMLEIAQKMEHRFGTVITFANPKLRDCRVTASFSDDDLLEEVLTVICGVSKSHFTIQGNKVIIDGKGCNN
jgi:ferric-dicitrate binding protein FerR (iron transport regulator)